MTGCFVACLIALIAFLAIYTGNPILQLLAAIGTILLITHSTQGK